ncbi:helicase associated domain-containing protein [Streptomyces sp. NPDC060049]
MVWSHFDVAWAEGLSAARGWAAEHGHLPAPLDAAFQGAPVGIWLKNARVAARKAQEMALVRRLSNGVLLDVASQQRFGGAVSLDVAGQSVCLSRAR